VVASFPLCLLIVMAVWEYPARFSDAIDVLMVTSHVQAMSVLMGCSTLTSAMVVCGSAAVAQLSLSTALIPTLRLDQ
jgi:hypothetical protein